MINQKFTSVSCTVAYIDVHMCDGKAAVEKWNTTPHRPHAFGGSRLLAFYVPFDYAIYPKYRRFSVSIRAV